MEVGLEASSESTLHFWDTSLNSFLQIPKTNKRSIFFSNLIRAEGSFPLCIHFSLLYVASIGEEPGVVN